jgi:hypothetical protein
MLVIVPYSSLSLSLSVSHTMQQQPLLRYFLSTSRQFFSRLTAEQIYSYGQYL